MTKYSVILILLFSSLSVNFTAIAMTVAKTPYDKQRVITDSISKKLIDNYVFPNVANKVAKQSLKKNTVLNITKKIWKMDTR
jgi:hypothetical protein